MTESLDILVADDERAVIGLLKQVFKMGGYAIRTASNGEEAIQKVKEKLPGFVITDSRMPGKNGFNVIDYLVGTKPDHSQRPPIILMSGTEGQEEVSRYCVEKFGHYDPREQRIVASGKPIVDILQLLEFVNEFRDTGNFDPFSGKYQKLFPQPQS